MSNMSYCRFENTVRDLKDCEDFVGDQLSQDENEARKELIKTCIRIAEDFTGDDLDESFPDNQCDDYVAENGDE